MIQHHRFSVWLAAIFAVVCGLAVSMPSFATTYTYNSPNYTSIGGTGTPPVYTTAMHITGSFTTAAPLPANMPYTYIGPPGSPIQTWSFNDGLHTYSASDTSLLYAFVSTDSAGNIQSFSFGGLSPLPPNTIGQLMNGFVFSSLTPLVQAASVAPCNGVGANNQCTSADGPNGNSFAQVPSAGTFGSSASPGSSTTVLETSLSPSAVGQSVTFTATVTGNAPTGTVTFKDGTTTLCNAVALAAGATATCTISTLTAGSHNITATYGGDPNNTASTSAVLVQVVTAVAPPPPPTSLAVPAPMLSLWSVFALLLGLAGLALWRHRAH